MIRYKVYNDRSGNLVTEEKRFGKNIDSVLTHTENLILANKTGCNASMKNDGNVAATKFITKKGMVPQQMASTKDHRFTLLPFTSATGDAVCCVVIFMSDKIGPEFKVKEGIDVRKNQVGTAKGKLKLKLVPDKEITFQVDQVMGQWKTN